MRTALQCSAQLHCGSMQWGAVYALRLKCRHHGCMAEWCGCTRGGCDAVQCNAIQTGAVAMRATPGCGAVRCGSVWYGAAKLQRGVVHLQYGTAAMRFNGHVQRRCSKPCSAVQLRDGSVHFSAVAMRCDAVAMPLLKLNCASLTLAIITSQCSSCRGKRWQQ